MSVHISKKAFISIAASLAIILIGYAFHKQQAEKIPEPQVSEVTSSVPVTLEDTSWVWVRTELLDGKIMKAENDKFILSFDKTLGRVTSATDCNTFNSTYVVDGEVLSFAQFGSTKMYCENSQEGDYSRQLSLATSYMIFNDQLYINLNRDFGTMVFKKNANK